MTDPRFTDPRYNDPRLTDPVLRRDDSAAGGMWAWIAGVAVLLLIGFLIIAGNNSNTASSGSSPTVTTSTTRMAPSTTGSDTEAESRADDGFDRLELKSRQFMADIGKQQPAKRQHERRYERNAK